MTVVQEVVDSFEGFKAILADVGASDLKVDYTSPLTDFIPKVQASHESNFDGRHSPEGETWPALAASTIARKGHDIPLVEFMRLKPSILELSHPDHVGGVSHRGFLFGTSVEYAGYHQYGAGKIPQREFVGMPVALVDELVDVVADHEVESLKLKVG